jgi:hypothetical protein
MDDIVKKTLFIQLQNLTSEMNVPPFRQKDPRWLLRNVGINNSTHPNLSNVIEICKKLLR